jgi:dCMP deaminase
VNGRPDWDETWTALAVLMSRRSRCPSGAGAVIVDEKQRVVSTGYTGPPARFRGVTRVGAEGWDCERHCPRRQMDPMDRPKTYGLECPTAHAEQNAVSFADRSRTEGGTFYV